MRWTLGLAMVLFGVMVASCGGSSASSTPTPRPAVEPTISTTPVAIGTSTDAALAAGLLTAADLGAGWTQQPTQDSTVAETYYCGTKVPAPPVAAVAFFANDEQGQAIFEGLSRLPDADAASSFARSVRAAHDNCTDWISTDGSARTEWHTDSFGPVDLGDEATVEQATMVSGTGTSYMFLIRKGDVLLSFATIGPEATGAGADNARIDATTRAHQAYDKLAAAVDASR
ncbi:MAG TPA: hypothetical protein VFY79_13235 [Dehalococcoidia bacterium]|nr:hypothetical protein [Dehalococcoidia bacterium]